MKKVKRKLLCFVLAALLMLGILPANGLDGIFAADTPSAIAVEKVDFDGDTAYADFIRGVDISSYDALYESGVRYYDYEGNKLETYGGFFELLKESGVNWVRIRIWNHPYNDDAKTEGYGAGNVDVERAIKMGKAASDAGLKVLADFHYSDFWADPGKSRAPKAWQHYLDDEDLDGLATELKNYTKTSLVAMRNAGVDVGMVQVGNETNNAICGVWAEQDGVVNRTKMCKLFKAGCQAVREVDESILIALHFADPHDPGFQLGWAEDLADNGVDYDVFASSYYPFWHGDLENLNSVLSEIAGTYDKKVMVAETSWAYTEEDGDGTEGHSNVIPGRGDLSAYGGASVQAQADELRAVIYTIAHTKNGIGVFYWEPAWIPAYTALGEEYANYDADALNKNKELWENYGTGWTSTHLGAYADEGEIIGEDKISGTEWDNQALFTFDGKPLESLKTWLYVKDGKEGVPEGYLFKAVYINGEGKLEQWYEVEGKWYSRVVEGVSYWKVQEGSGLAAGTEEDYDVMYSDADGAVLTLKDFQFTCADDGACAIWSDVPLTLKLTGENRIEHHSNGVMGALGGLTVEGTGSLTLVTTAEEIVSEDGEPYTPVALEIPGVYDDEGNRIDNAVVSVGAGATLSCEAQQETAVYMECSMEEFTGSILVPAGQNVICNEGNRETIAVSEGDGNYSIMNNMILQEDGQEEPTVVSVQVVVKPEEESEEARPYSGSLSDRIYPVAELNGEALAAKIKELSKEDKLLVVDLDLAEGKDLPEGTVIDLGIMDLTGFEHAALYLYNAEEGSVEQISEMEDGYLGCWAEEPGFYFVAEASGSVDDFWDSLEAFWEKAEAFYSASDDYYGNEENGIVGSLNAYREALEAGSQDPDGIVELYKAAVRDCEALKSAQSEALESYKALEEIYSGYTDLQKAMVKNAYADAVTAAKDISEEVEEPEVNDISTKVIPGKGAPVVALVGEAKDIFDLIQLTEEETQAVAAGDEITITLLEELITEPTAEEKEAIGAALDGYKEGLYLDYKLSLAIGEMSKNVSELDAPITISVTIPEELRCSDASVERSYRMITIHNGKVSVIEGEFDAAENTFTFETDGFSTYALVYKDTPKTTQPDNGDKKDPNTSDKKDPNTSDKKDPDTSDKTDTGKPQNPTGGPQTGDTNNLPVVGGILLAGLVMVEAALLMHLRRRRTGR